MRQKNYHLVSCDSSPAEVHVVTYICWVALYYEPSLLFDMLDGSWCQGTMDFNQWGSFFQVASDTTFLPLIVLSWNLLSASDSFSFTLGKSSESNSTPALWLRSLYQWLSLTVNCWIRLLLLHFWRCTYIPEYCMNDRYRSHVIFRFDSQIIYYTKHLSYFICTQLEDLACTEGESQKHCVERIPASQPMSTAERLQFACHGCTNGFAKLECHLYREVHSLLTVKTLYVSDDIFF